MTIPSWPCPETEEPITFEELKCGYWFESFKHQTHFESIEREISKPDSLPTPPTEVSPKEQAEMAYQMIKITTSINQKLNEMGVGSPCPETVEKVEVPKIHFLSAPGHGGTWNAEWENRVIKFTPPEVRLQSGITDFLMRPTPCH